MPRAPDAAQYKRYIIIVTFTVHNLVVHVQYNHNKGLFYYILDMGIFIYLCVCVVLFLLPKASQIPVISIMSGEKEL